MNKFSLYKEKPIHKLSLLELRDYLSDGTFKPPKEFVKDIFAKLKGFNNFKEYKAYQNDNN